MNYPESEDHDLYPPDLLLKPYCLNNKTELLSCQFFCEYVDHKEIWYCLERAKPCLDALELQHAACTGPESLFRHKPSLSQIRPQSLLHSHLSNETIESFHPSTSPVSLYSPGSLSSITSPSLFLGFPVPVTGRNGKPKPLVLKESGTSFFPPPPVSLEHPHTSGGSQETGCQIGGGDNAWCSGVLGSSRSSDISLSSEVSSLELSFRKSRIAAWEGL